MDVVQFQTAATSFAQEIRALLDATLPGDTSFDDSGLRSENFKASFRATKPLSIRPGDSSVPLVSCEYGLCPNTSGQHLAVERSSFRLAYRTEEKLRPKPIVRFEYERNAHSKPVSHVHVHADSVPMGYFLLLANKPDTAFQQSDLHFPTGGHRYRVCLEDVIELVIREFGAEGKPGWQEVVQQGRARYRSSQAQTVIRKNLPMAIEVLRAHGYEVRDPESTLTEPGQNEIDSVW